MKLKLDRLEQIARGGGQRDDAALREFRALARDVMLATTSGYVREKLTSAASYADDLFSDRKHRKHDMGATTGVDRCRGFILEDLSNARSNLDVGARPAP